MPAPTCVCGHEKAAHEHFRAGSDCGACGPVVCPRFRRAPARRGGGPGVPTEAQAEQSPTQRVENRSFEAPVARMLRRPRTG